MGVAPTTGHARAKLLLFGEHSAVYGHPAVGLALPWPLTVVHSPGSAWSFPGLGPHEPVVRSLVDWFVDRAAREGLPSPAPGSLAFTTAIPVASGYGSSGALCACLVNLFFPALPLPDRDRLAWLAEGRFHGTPSGIDTALALRTGWWALDPSTRPVAATALADPGLVLVTGAVVRVSNTKTLVTGLAAQKTAGDGAVVEALGRLGGIAAEAITGWNSAGRDGLCDLVRCARKELQSLGLETPALTAVLDAGLGCPGARAGKLSGAGGGGAFLLVFHDVASAQAAIPVLEASVEPSQWTARPRLVVPGSKILYSF